METKQYLQDRVYLTAVRQMGMADYRRDCGPIERGLRARVLGLITPEIDGKPLAKCNAREICETLLEEYMKAEKRTKKEWLYEGITSTDERTREITDEIEKLKSLNPLERKLIIPKAKEIIEMINILREPYQKEFAF